MEPTALFTYAATLSALTLAPGPLVAVLAARSANSDRRGACALAIGICAGDILVVFAVCAGLGYWLQEHPEVFAFAKYVGVGFLLWMAIRMWIDSAKPLDNAVPIGGTAVSLFTGFAICLSSPQTVVMYLVLLPGVVDLTVIRPQDMLLLIVATIGALFGVFLLVILLAGTLQKALRSPGSVALWGRSMASAVVLSAVWVLFA